MLQTELSRSKPQPLQNDRLAVNPRRAVSCTIQSTDDQPSPRPDAHGVPVQKPSPFAFVYWFQPEPSRQPPPIHTVTALNPFAATASSAAVISAGASCWAMPHDENVRIR